MRHSALACSLAVLLVAVAVDAYWIEPYRLEVNRWEIVSSKIEKPIRLAVIADLQTDRVGRYEREVFERVMAANPDLIVLPGDYLQIASPGRRWAEGKRLRDLVLKTGLDAPLGVFALQGDMERDDWEEFFWETPVRTVSSRTFRRTGGIALTLLAARESHGLDTEVLPVEPFHITIGHSPNFALGEVSADLLIAGHTHGGQVRLPTLNGLRPLLTFSAVPRSWAAGLTSLTRGRTLIVSRGVGMERGGAPRLRFLCPPEIVLVDLLPAPVKGSAG